jgi:hypothetical protein
LPRALAPTAEAPTDVDPKVCDSSLTDLPFAPHILHFALCFFFDLGIAATVARG